MQHAFNKKFWRIKESPLSDKIKDESKVTLVEDSRIISDDKEEIYDF